MEKFVLVICKFSNCWSIFLALIKALYSVLIVKITDILWFVILDCKIKLTWLYAVTGIVCTYVRMCVCVYPTNNDQQYSYEGQKSQVEWAAQSDAGDDEGHNEDEEADDHQSSHSLSPSWGRTQGEKWVRKKGQDLSTFSVSSRLFSRSVSLKETQDDCKVSLLLTLTFWFIHLWNEHAFESNTQNLKSLLSIIHVVCGAIILVKT